MTPRRILVIKLGALGDFVQALGPFAAIRARFPTASITLLTTRPFVGLARACPWFDEVWIDDKPRFWQIRRLLTLRRRLRGGGFDRVYDLQTSDRSSSYFRLIGGTVEWSGIARGCSHPHANPNRDRMHTIERQREQLAMAGIPDVPPPDLSWVAAGTTTDFGLGDPYVLICPGGAAHRPAKRWPAERFGAVAARLTKRGLIPVLLGTEAEAEAIATIRATCPKAVDLSGRTGFLDILGLGRSAVAAIGNDTGPMHLIAAAGCPSVVLFSADSNPDLCAPRGRVTILRRPNLADLGEAETTAALIRLLSV
ncbi:glycosyltransferase family 9 protein [Magnetospirillum molischianum]|uniref:Glycosyl transferase, family 9 n=1 Tax=Magnetospirillum molischianum DSM 120 TaxID=1150626 RepID=H8FN46_MAGML|nr:glycosyltransferase family 9 protein [Magnetospirillum molischianum]CCG39784.1 Glycosyl transferase, family 9 [Magnetospirillum molischianum DSM 120]